MRWLGSRKTIPKINPSIHLKSTSNLLKSPFACFRATHNRTGSLLGTFQPPSSTAPLFPFNIVPKSDCNLTRFDRAMLVHSDSEEKYGFSVNWWAGRWKRWNNIVVKVEGVGGLALTCCRLLRR